MDGITYDWRVSWTTNGRAWHERGFFTYESAREFAHGLIEQNEGNDLLRLGASRMMAVNTTDFLDLNREAREVRLGPSLVGVAETFA